MRKSSTYALGDDLDEDRLALAQHVLNTLNAAIGNLGDVEQTCMYSNVRTSNTKLLARHTLLGEALELDKGAIGLDGCNLHATFVKKKTKESEHTNTNLALVDLVGLGHGRIGVVTRTAATSTLAACIEWHVS